MSLRNKIILAALTFLVAYVFSLILWIQVKPYYGYGLTQVAARLAGLSTGFRLESFGMVEETISFSFVGPVLTERGLGELVVEHRITVSSFTYNVPLTVALLAGLFFFLEWRKRFLVEIATLLIFVHLLFLYLFCTLKVFLGIWQVEVQGHSIALQVFLEFMWTFTQNLVIPFEPFLVATYLWLRGRQSKPADTKQRFVSRKKKGKKSKKRR